MTATTKEKIREFILGWTKLDSLTYESPLVEHRLIDSMGLMRIVGFIEEEFGLSIEPEDIGPQDFTNIEKIAKLVERLRASRSPHSSSNSDSMRDDPPAAEPTIREHDGDAVRTEPSTSSDRAADPISPESAPHLAFWKKELAGVPGLPGLPTDHPRPTGDDFRSRSPKQDLSRALWERVVALAESRKTTTLAVALAAFDVVLHRTSDQTDIVVGVPFARTFINPCAVRTRVEPDDPFSMVLARTDRALREANDHQEVPFSHVIEAVQPTRSHSAHPIFQVMFAVSQEPMVRETSKLDLEVSVVLQHLSVVWEHRSSLFEPETIAGMMTAYRRTLEQIVADPEILVSQIEMLDEESRRLLATICVRPPEASALEGSLIGRLVAVTEEKPDATAAISLGRACTYRELTESVSRVAHHLREAGIDTDTVVGVCLDRSNALLAAQLGVLAARGAYLPLDPAYPADRIEYMIQDSGARVVLTEQKHASLIPSGVAALDVFRCLEREAPRTLMLPSPSSLAYVLYTSGSTGRPKGVAVRHQALVNFLHSVAQAPGFDTSRRMLAVTTSCFDISGLELYLPLWLGGTVEIATSEEARNGVALRRRLDSGEIGAMQATPATWQILRLAAWKNQKKVAVLVGGEALDPELARYHVRNGAQVWNLYGPTETTIWSSLLRVDDTALDPTRVHGSVPVGHPFSNTSIFVLDRELEPRTPGIIGDVYIAGSGLAAGYVGKPSLTASKMIPDASGIGARMYYTGDLGRWRHEGRLEIAGRRDNQIKLHGFRIELGEIESALSSQPGVAETAVVATQGPSGPMLVGFVTARDGIALEPELITAALGRILPAHMVPAHIEVVREFPRTANGKTDRKVLAAWKKSRPNLQPPVS